MKQSDDAWSMIAAGVFCTYCMDHDQETCEHIDEVNYLSGIVSNGCSKKNKDISDIAYKKGLSPGQVVFNNE